MPTNALIVLRPESIIENIQVNLPNIYKIQIL